MFEQLNRQLVQVIQSTSKQKRLLAWHCIDLIGIILAVTLSNWIFRPFIQPKISYTVALIALIYFIYLILIHVTKQSNYLSRYNQLIQLGQLILTIAVSGGLGAILLSLHYRDQPLRIILMTVSLASLFILGSRLLWLALYRYHQRKTLPGQEHLPSAIVLGAGEGGALFMETYKRGPHKIDIVAILDNDPTKHHQIIGGVPVAGDLSQLPQLLKEYPITQVVIAIPSLTPEEYDEIFTQLSPYGLEVFQMPPVEDVLQGTYQMKGNLKKVEISDLLGRREVQLDSDTLQTELSGKTILVTGAGGSIGSEICRQVLKYGPAKLLLLGHGETSIYHIYHELRPQSDFVEVVPVIADVKDKERLVEIMTAYQPDIVYHAAAHKHVPMMEMNPREALTNNVLGTYYLAQAVDETRVPKMVMISTDKAVRPPNIMGASKRMAELIMTGMNKVSQSSYCAVRFGNVLGSRGSVIPLFERQIAAGGPVTVTDFRMTRYFMTIPEASQLVIYAGAHAQGGEVFILDMGEPVKILDLAQKMIKLSGHSLEEIPIKEIGIRPGEKLYEELLIDKEEIKRNVSEKVFVGKVTELPMEELDHLIEDLITKEDSELKEAMIRIANDSAGWTNIVPSQS